LSQHYYERKMKEFFELNLGTMTMEEHEKWFFELLKYVDFIKDEKVKIQRFLSGLPSLYIDKIKYDNPKTLEETIMRVRHLYEQRKGRPIFQKSWNDKMKDKKDQRQKGFKPPFFRIIPKQISKFNSPKMNTRLQIHLEKGQGNNLFNFGDVREIIYIGISLTKEKE
jgi:hypothetical protein